MDSASNNPLAAELIRSEWGRVDIKLVLDGAMHILRWRRGLFYDTLRFDERLVARAGGLWGRETMFGFAVTGEDGAEHKLLLTVEAQPDWNRLDGSMAPKGVRLETERARLIATGSLDPERREPFQDLYERAIRALGLS